MSEEGGLGGGTRLKVEGEGEEGSERVGGG